MSEALGKAQRAEGREQCQIPSALCSLLSALSALILQIFFFFANNRIQRVFGIFG